LSTGQYFSIEEHEISQCAIADCVLLSER